MNLASWVRWFWLFVVGLAVTLGYGCALMPKATQQPSFYALDGAGIEAREATTNPSTRLLPAPTLIVNPPQAASGFDSKHIIYEREAHKLEYFAHSEWIDTPAHMLAPLIVAAIANGGAFRAVVMSPSTAAGDLRLDTVILRLQQNFIGRPSRVRFTLRAYVLDNAMRRILAVRDFDETVAAAGDDPYGGVVAVNRAVQIVLEKLTSFCAEAAGNWQPALPKL